MREHLEYRGLLQLISNTSFRKQIENTQETVDFIKVLMRSGTGNTVFLSQRPKLLVPQLVLHDISLTTLRMHLLVHKVSFNDLAMWGIVYRNDKIYTWYSISESYYVGEIPNHTLIEDKPYYEHR